MHFRICRECGNGFYCGQESSDDAKFENTNEGTAEDEDAWSSEQQSQLEAALKKYSPNASMVDEKGNNMDRWRLLATSVDGKTRVQCIKRFKMIPDQILKAKASAATK